MNEAESKLNIKNHFLCIDNCSNCTLLFQYVVYWNVNFFGQPDGETASKIDKSPLLYQIDDFSTKVYR